MSITFSVPFPAGQAAAHQAAGHDSYECQACQARELNLANVNALDLLAWLGLPVTPEGEHPAADVAARCRRRLWMEARNLDAAQAGEDTGGPGTGTARVVSFGREEGYLRGRARDLLRVVTLAPEGSMMQWA